MSYGPPNTQTDFLPTYQFFPEDLSQLMVVLTDMYITMATAINQRQFGGFSVDEQLNGQFFTNQADAQLPNSGFRKIFYITTAIPAATTATFAHGLLNVSYITAIYGGVRNTATGIFRPLPYVDTVNVTNQVGVTVDATNVNVINGATAAQIDTGVIVLEYLKT